MDSRERSARILAACIARSRANAAAYGARADAAEAAGDHERARDLRRAARLSREDAARQAAAHIPADL